MRILAEIPHEKCRISIFHMNQKYILKLEQGAYEQTYKVSEMDVANLEEVKALLDEAFLDVCLQRFETMRTDWLRTLQDNSSY